MEPAGSRGHVLGTGELRVDDRDQPTADVVGPVAGGAAALGGAAAVLAYASDSLGGPQSLADQDSAASPTPPAAGELQPQAAPVSEVQASRFLTQATNGATREDIQYVHSAGIPWWLLLQFAMDRGQTHWEHLDALGYARASAYVSGSRATRLWDGSIWRQLITAPDQLRQRVALALLDILVVSVNGLPQRFPHYAMAAYMDLLLDHAFGNFRTLLSAITTNSAMGQFLTFLGSSKESGQGAMPDENYARELMQLFTIGLYELNMDGTLKLDADGEPIETFTQDDVSQLARVFTGLRLQSPQLATPDAHRQPLVIDAAQNETGSSTFLGRTVSGGGMRAIDAALDVIFRHRNMAPFIAKALIQRLVTSNPSPAYIRRVANRFANDGEGVRGDMRSVIIAILTDSEARSDGALSAPHTGRLRDPVQRITGWARAFNATSASGEWPIGDLTGVGLGQSPGRSPSVFNFFSPRYSPANSELQRRGLVAPELQIADEQSTIDYLNLMSTMIRRGRSDVRPDYAGLMALADDDAALFDEVNLLLAAGQISASSRAIILSALSTMPSNTEARRNNRIWTAIMVTMACPEYLVVQ